MKHNENCGEYDMQGRDDKCLQNIDRRRRNVNDIKKKTA